jgi:hypothetical protein
MTDEAITTHLHLLNEELLACEAAITDGQHQYHRSAKVLRITNAIEKQKLAFRLERIYNIIQFYQKEIQLLIIDQHITLIAISRIVTNICRSIAHLHGSEIPQDVGIRFCNTDYLFLVSDPTYALRPYTRPLRPSQQNQTYVYRLTTTPANYTHPYPAIANIQIADYYNINVPLLTNNPGDIAHTKTNKDGTIVMQLIPSRSHAELTHNDGTDNSARDNDTTGTRSKIPTKSIVFASDHDTILNYIERIPSTQHPKTQLVDPANILGITATIDILKLRDSHPKLPKSPPPWSLKTLQQTIQAELELKNQYITCDIQKYQIIVPTLRTILYSPQTPSRKRCRPANFEEIRPLGITYPVIIDLPPVLKNVVQQRTAPQSTPNLKKLLTATTKQQQQPKEVEQTGAKAITEDAIAIEPNTLPNEDTSHQYTQEWLSNHPTTTWTSPNISEQQPQPQQQFYTQSPTWMPQHQQWNHSNQQWHQSPWPPLVSQPTQMPTISQPPWPASQWPQQQQQWIPQQWSPQQQQQPQYGNNPWFNQEPPNAFFQ